MHLSLQQVRWEESGNPIAPPLNRYTLHILVIKILLSWLAPWMIETIGDLPRCWAKLLDKLNKQLDPDGFCGVTVDISDSVWSPHESSACHISLSTNPARSAGPLSWYAWLRETQPDMNKGKTSRHEQNLTLEYMYRTRRSLAELRFILGTPQTVNAIKCIWLAPLVAETIFWSQCIRYTSKVKF